MENSHCTDNNYRYTDNDTGNADKLKLLLLYVVYEMKTEDGMIIHLDVQLRYTKKYYFFFFFQFSPF